MQSEATTVTEPSQTDVDPGEPGTTPAPAPAAAGNAVAPRTSRFDRRWLIVVAVVVGYLLQLAWRLWLIRTATTPIAQTTNMAPNRKPRYFFGEYSASSEVAIG